MAMMAEFKDFAMKGNVVDLAVGVIIGGAFGKIVDSLVQDIVMPLLGKVIGGLDFTNMYLPLAGQAANLSLTEAKKIGAVLAYVFFNGMTVSTLGGSTFTQLVFNFKVTPNLVLTGMILALLIGFVGGLMPAVRAARMPVTTALREA